MLIVLLSAGCSALATSTPIPTATTIPPTNTPIPPTATLTPSATPTLTPTPTVFAGALTIQAYSTSFAATLTAAPTNTPRLTPTTYPTPNRNDITTQVGVLPPPPGIKIIYDKGVGQDQQEAAQTGLTMAYRYLGDVGIKNVLIMESMDNLAQEYARLLGVPINDPRVSGAINLLRNGTFQAVFTDKTALVRLDNTFRAASREDRWGLIVHEYYHGVQQYLAKESSGSAPLWFVEGSAKYVQNRFLIDLGARDRQRVRDDIVLLTRGLVNPLESMRNYPSAEDSVAHYNLGYLAVEYLVQKYGEDRVLSAYWQNLAHYPSAFGFEMTFGKSEESFYQEFASYRQQNFPPYCTLEDISASKVGIRGVGRFAAGTNNSLSLFQDPAYIAYVFCIQGFTQPRGILSTLAPPMDLAYAQAFWASCGGNCVILYVKSDVRPKTYSVRVRSPDGRWAETSFVHER